MFQRMSIYYAVFLFILFCVNSNVHTAKSKLGKQEKKKESQTRSCSGYSGIAKNGTTNQCLPFAPPPCPCAQGMTGGPTCRAVIDLGFIVPVSSKKHRQPFVDVEVSAFIQALVSRFDLSLGRTQVSVVTYGTTPNMAFSFNRFSCKRQVLHKLGCLSQDCSRGRPRIGKALTYADRHMFKGPSSKPKVVVLITDNRSRDDVKAPAKSLRSQNVRIISIGIGRYIDGSQMDQIVNKPTSENIFTAGLNFLHLTIDKLVRNICLGAGGIVDTPNQRPCLCAQG